MATPGQTAALMPSRSRVSGFTAAVTSAALLPHCGCQAESVAGELSSQLWQWPPRFCHTAGVRLWLSSGTRRRRPAGHGGPAAGHRFRAVIGVGVCLKQALRLIPRARQMLTSALRFPPPRSGNHASLSAWGCDAHPGISLRFLYVLENLRFVVFAIFA